MRLSVTPRQFDTILAALRLWQKNLDAIGDADLMEIAENGRTGDDACLAEKEIDDLCEDLNCGGVSRHVRRRK